MIHRISVVWTSSFWSVVQTWRWASADWACVCSLSPQAWWDGDGERGGEGELWGHQESSDGSAGEPDHTFQVWTSHRFTTKIWWKPVGFYFSTMWEFKHIYHFISFGFVSDVWVELIFRIISLQRHWACLHVQQFHHRRVLIRSHVNG